MRDKADSRSNRVVCIALVECGDGKPQSKNSSQIFYEQGHSELKIELSSFGTGPNRTSFEKSQNYPTP